MYVSENTFQIEICIYVVTTTNYKKEYEKYFNYLF